MTMTDGIYGQGWLLYGGRGPVSPLFSNIRRSRGRPPSRLTEPHTRTESLDRGHAARGTTSARRPSRSTAPTRPRSQSRRARPTQSTSRRATPSFSRATSSLVLAARSPRWTSWPTARSASCRNRRTAASASCCTATSSTSARATPGSLTTKTPRKSWRTASGSETGASSTPSSSC